MFVRVDVFDDDAIDKVNLLDRRLSPAGMRLFLGGAVATHLRDRIENRFHVEGDDAVGGHWAPLRPTTAMIRANQGYGAQRPINRRTNSLYNWIRTNRVTDTRVEFPATRGDKILRSKLRVAQVGGYPTSGPKTSRFGPSRPAPPRPVLAIGAKDRIVIHSQLAEFIRSGTVV